MTPNYKQADMWQSDANVICVTTNGCFKDAKLLMGGGTALQAKERFPALPLYAQQVIMKHYPYRVKEGRTAWFIHGFLDLPFEPQIFGAPVGRHYALFQTKGLVSRDSLPWLIGYSAMGLMLYARANPGYKIALPFPGIGHGKLNPADVKPLLADLPENVTVYTQ